MANEKLPLAVRIKDGQGKCWVNWGHIMAAVDDEARTRLLAKHDDAHARLSTLRDELNAKGYFGCLYQDEQPRNPCWVCTRECVDKNCGYHPVNRTEESVAWLIEHRSLWNGQDPCNMGCEFYPMRRGCPSLRLDVDETGNWKVGPEIVLPEINARGAQDRML